MQHAETAPRTAGMALEKRSEAQCFKFQLRQSNVTLNSIFHSVYETRPPRRTGGHILAIG